jgi:hypothetical protein
MAEDLTVIVVALLGGEALYQCVAAVRAQCPHVLVIRRDGSIVDAEGRSAGAADRLDIPAKRRSAVELATTKLVALVEDTVVPDSRWADAITAAFSDDDVLACGGPVRTVRDLPPQTRALTLSEYGRYNDRQAAGEVSALPGCNFAFRRDALLDAMRGTEGLVDLEVFRRLEENGGKIAWAPGAAVTFAHAYPEGARLKTRFEHGRIYAGAKTSLGERAATALKAFLLPPVMTARSVRQAGPAELRWISTLGWLLLQHSAWAAGEFAGALLGPSRRGVAGWR